MKENWPNTKVAHLLKIDIPIIQAPMAGGATTPELVAAVSNAGGLGCFAAGYLSADEMRVNIKKIRQLTDKSFCVNLFIPEKHAASGEQIDKARKAVQASCEELQIEIPMIKPPYAPSFDDQIEVIIEENVSVFSCAFGIPSTTWIERLKNTNIIFIGTATNLHEGIALEKSGVDAIVAQGKEAGGHRGTFLGKAEDSLTDTLTLIAQLKNKVKIPVIAAGGLMNAKSIVKAMKSGASAVQMGSAFLCCHESGINHTYKQLLLTIGRNNTTLTRAFSGKLARGIDNKFIQRMHAYENTILDYPIQNTLTSVMRKEAAKKNLTDFMSLWAGENAYLCESRSAAELIHEWNEDVIKII